MDVCLVFTEELIERSALSSARLSPGNDRLWWRNWIIALVLTQLIRMASEIFPSECHFWQNAVIGSIHII